MFSLVIPTYNRAPILRRSLAHLLSLEDVTACEVIVVNDGSTDETAAVLEGLRQAHPTILRVFEITNGGPARARNVGLQAARNPRILFVDDDVFPRAGMLQSHSRLLDAGYTGSQGLLLWHEEIRITPLIRYIDSRGSQFAFDQVKNPFDLDFAFVYTGNFAVDRAAVLDAGGFDETFFSRELAFSAFEDTVLGYNLKRRSARIALNKEAVADHLHDMTEQGYFNREYKVGRAVGLLCQKYPGLARSLGLDRKDFMVATQAQLLRVLNTADMLRPLIGYKLSMRLRHREAFCRGFLQFKHEAAGRSIPAMQ